MQRDFPGLYHLLDLCKDNGSNGLVNKIIILKEELKNLCNDFVPNSFKSISEIDYKKLNSISLKLIGCYGNHNSIAKFLLDKNIIDHQLNEKLIYSSQQIHNIQETDGKPYLRPGIYFLKVNSELGLVIHWPEYGCYENNTSSRRKKNMINIHRYLTKLTDYQICLMSEQDLDGFDWNLNDSDSDDEDLCQNCEVKESQEQEDIFSDGFNTLLPKNIKSEIKNQPYNGNSLYPKIIESISYQAFFTQKIIPPQNIMIHVTKSNFNKEFMNRRVRINRSTMNMEMLEILVNGLNIDDIKEQLEKYKALTNAKKELDQKKGERTVIQNDAKILEVLAYKKLYKLYGRLENRQTGEDEIESNKDQDFFSKYPKLKKRLNQALIINTAEWKTLKRRFIFGSLLFSEIRTQASRNEEMDINEVYTTMYKSFYDLLSSPHTFKHDNLSVSQIYRNYVKHLSPFAQSNHKHKFNFEFDDHQIKEFERQSINSLKSLSDSEIISKVIESFNDCPDNSVSIRKLFFDKYIQWKIKKFPENINKIVPKWSDYKKDIIGKLDQEHERQKQETKKNAFETLCNSIEEKFQNGPLFNVKNITAGTWTDYIPGPLKNIVSNYQLTYDQPAQLQITIYETILEQEDCLKIQEDAFHIPKPKLPTRGYDFIIDPENDELKHISKFDHPKNPKYLVIIRDNKTNKMKLYFNTAPCLGTSIKNDSHLRALNTSKHCLIAVNESKGLIGIYDSNRGVLDVFSFDEDRVNLYLRNPNVQILQWYSNLVPDIKHFLFIKDTEELCFVEKSGHARIYSLVSGRFNGGVSQFPPKSTAILSTPDGACIVAFVKELHSDSESVSDILDRDTLLTASSIDSNSPPSPLVDKEDRNINAKESKLQSVIQKEMVKAYIYFCSEFEKSANKVIEMPPNMQSSEFFQFSTLHKRQIHLTALDVNNGLFHSVIIKITLGKTQYQFRQRSHKKLLGQVKFESEISNNISNEFIITGRETNFTQDIKERENIIIKGERHKVIEIISDKQLKLVGNFSSISNEKSWLDFRIEPKIRFNDLIDSYKLMFEKYPIDGCIDNEQNKPLNLHIVLDILMNGEDIDEYSTNFKGYVSEMFQDLKKPQTSLKKFSTFVTTFRELDIEDLIKKKKITNYQLGEWVIQLSCLIPIQIAVAKNNQFQPLRDGLSTENDQPGFNDGYRPVDSIASNISFGWYEGIFKHFGNHKVKVVSSMGEQSCGKSYLLNHLAGTTFDGDAMRCTEGVWMSLVITKKYVYVALDFEGLNSIERTPQEDLFLTLFNTTVSNLILFKNQFTVNRDMSSMFRRFQDGATTLKADPKIFQAKLCIIIKDVPKNDRKGITKEFSSRFKQLVKEEGGDNFITKMYKDDLDIMPWPVFNEAAWFKSLVKVKSTLDEQEAKYENARIFLQSTKVMMAKLQICDWGSLDESLIQNRISELKELLHNAVFLGIEKKDEHLMNRDTGEKIDDPIISNSELFNNLTLKEKEASENELGIEQKDEHLMHRDAGEKIDDPIISSSDDNLTLRADSELNLYEKNFILLSADLRKYFEVKIQPRNESLNDNEWFSSLKKFFKYIIGRRTKRVQEWFKQNTLRFPQDNNGIIIAKYDLDKEINELTLVWTLCGLTCHLCGLRCLNNRDHKGDHDCLTDHRCHIACEVHENNENNLQIPTCSHKAGHEGKHACNDKHLCGEPCNFNKKRNCQKFCAKEIEHKDDIHLCQATRHYCGEPCSLNTSDYQCPNKCITPHEEEHTEHKCENETCPIECSMKDCQRKCQINDNHFHAFSERYHFCGNEHQCLRDCEQPGICKVHVEPREQEAIYQGIVQEIKFTKYIQLSEKLKCSKKIPRNKFEHDGPHSHGDFHFCDERCPFCEYYCILPYEHSQKQHKTDHGNMIQTEFTAEIDEFEYKGYKLKIGDKGTFVLCGQFCKELGRHRHIDYCQNEKDCTLINQGQDIQHISGVISPNPERKKDFISHRLFWERTGFKDPYSAKELQEFVKCDHECRDEIHSSKKSYCELDLFHPPLNAESTPPNGIGYVSPDGHHFTCEKPRTFHIIFVLDRSSSMNGRDCTIESTPICNRLKVKHNNRLGAVFNAVYFFLHARLQPTSSMAPRIQDKISIILFNDEVVVPYENQSLTNAGAMLDKLLQHSAAGGTNYDLAITKAGSLIDTHFDPKRVNIVIFLSDGECNVPESKLNQICKRNQDKKSPLYLYTVLFGGKTSSPSLEQMAKIAQDYHPPNTSAVALRCQFTHTIDGISLVKHFTGIAESLRRHNPTLLKNIT